MKHISKNAILQTPKEKKGQILGLMIFLWDCMIGLTDKGKEREEIF